MTCGVLRSFEMTCGVLRSFEMTCGVLRSFEMTCGILRSFEMTCGVLRSFEMTCGVLRSFEMTCGVLRSFEMTCGVLRSFEMTCGVLRSFEMTCGVLRSFDMICRGSLLRCHGVCFSHTNDEGIGRNIHRLYLKAQRFPDHQSFYQYPVPNGTCYYKFQSNQLSTPAGKFKFKLKFKNYSLLIVAPCLLFTAN